MRHRFPLVPAALVALLSVPASALGQAGAGAVRGEIPAAQAGEFVGRTATVCGVVDGTRFAETTEGQPTFLFMAGNFPNHRFSARIWGRDRGDFDPPPEQLAGQTVCVTGEIRTANGRPEIIVRAARNLRVR
jgi:hypothetical protein